MQKRTLGCEDGGLTVGEGRRVFQDSHGADGRLRAGYFWREELLDPLPGQELDHVSVEFLQIDFYNKTTPLAQSTATALAFQPYGNTDLHPLIFHLSDTWTGWRWRAAAAPPVQDQTSCLGEHESRYVTNNYETTGDY